MFWFYGQETRGILAPQPGTQPAPPALEGEVITSGHPGKSHGLLCAEWVKLHPVENGGWKNSGKGAENAKPQIIYRIYTE